LRISAQIDVITVIYYQFLAVVCFLLACLIFFLLNIWVFGCSILTWNWYQHMIHCIWTKQYHLYILQYYVHNI
jgi:hypothetical protein